MRGVACMTKTRYRQIEQAMFDAFGDTDAARGVLSRMRQILRFDPAVSTLTAAHKQHVQAWRERKQRETGLSLHVLEGGQRRSAAKRRHAPST